MNELDGRSASGNGRPPGAMANAQNDHAIAGNAVACDVGAGDDQFPHRGARHQSATMREIHQTIARRKQCGSHPLGRPRIVLISHTYTRRPARRRAARFSSRRRASVMRREAAVCAHAPAWSATREHAHAPDVQRGHRLQPRCQGEPPGPHPAPSRIPVWTEGPSWPQANTRSCTKPAFPPGAPSRFPHHATASKPGRP